MHAHLDHGAVRLLTRSGLDWTHKYSAIAAAVASLGAEQAYLDGELCGMRPDGITSFSMIQLASDSGNAAALVFFLFDLLYLDGEDFSVRPLISARRGLPPCSPMSVRPCITAITRSGARTRSISLPARAGNGSARKPAHNEALRSHEGTAQTERGGEDQAVTLFTLKRRLTVVTESGSKKKWPA
jgi:hypothetical protein